MRNAQPAAFTMHDGPEPHADVSGRLNWLRASVLGANDGLLSTAGLVMGVAAATTDRTAILIAGVSGLVAGAVSMAIGEYVSVSTQRDTEKALIAKERHELAHQPEEEFAELVGIYRAKGLSEQTAIQVAHELHREDPLSAHLDAELGIDQDDLTNPWQAAISSFISFAIGALIPILAIFAPATAVVGAISWRIVAIVVSTLAGLVFAGWVSASLGGASRRRAMLRLLAWGITAMVFTYLVGSILGTSVG